MLIAFPLLFLIGFTAQQTSVCMVRAAQEVIHQHRSNRFIGFTLAAMVAMLALLVSAIAGRNPFAMVQGYDASWSAALGGALFAVGARINGRCATGTVAALASGASHHIATLVGMVIAAFATVAAGAAVFAAVMGVAVSTGVTISSDGKIPRPGAMALMITEGAAVPAVVLTVATIAALAVCAMLGWYLYRRRPRLPHPRRARHLPSPRGSHRIARHRWPPLIAMTIIGSASGLLYALDQHWPYTALIADVAHGAHEHLPEKILAGVVFFAGLIVGAKWSRKIHWRTASPQQWLQALAGGILMGTGAALVPGGNDTMLFTGIPMLLPNLLVAYLVMLVVLIGSEWLFPSPRWRKASPQKILPAKTKNRDSLITHSRL